jgi:hypothetical protein
VLSILDKGHTREEFIEVVAVCRDAGLTLVPTFVAFHPWLTLDAYCDLLTTIDTLQLVDHVAPIQLAIRLLIPHGSKLLGHPDLAPALGPFDPVTLAYAWTHADPRVDGLHREVTALVGTRTGADRRTVFEEIHAVAFERAGRPVPGRLPAAATARVPYVDEPWYCCAEPNPDDLRVV